MKIIDLNFVSHIIDGYISGINYDKEADLISYQEAEYAIKQLESLKNTLKHFIKDTNKLTENEDES